MMEIGIYGPLFILNPQKQKFFQSSDMRFERETTDKAAQKISGFLIRLRGGKPVVKLEAQVKRFDVIRC